MGRLKGQYYFRVRLLIPSALDNKLIVRSIIAIHGLDTRLSRTWVAYEAKDTSCPQGRTVHWLHDNDMLPSIIPEGRVFTYDYNANYLR